MPELPEVETVCRGLESEIKGLVINKIIINDQKLFHLNKNLKQLENKKILSLKRLGKYVQIQIEDSYLLVHLRMTGRLIYVKNLKNETLLESIKKGEAYLQNKVIRLIQSDKTKHIRIIFSLNNGLLYFFDPRRFGTIEYFNKEPSLKNNSIDALDPNLTKEYLIDRTKRIKQNVKAFLLNQKFIVGIGNIYASEILFLSKIHPERSWSSLSIKEIGLLIKNTRLVLLKAIKYGGTTFSDFQNSKGETGEYQNELFVYGREGEVCKKCKDKISRIIQSNRSTFFCSSCQNN